MSVAEHARPPALVGGSARPQFIRLLLGTLKVGWQERAACRKHDRPDVFFPPPARAETGTTRAQSERLRRVTIAEAKSVCRRCPVRAADFEPRPNDVGTGECLEFADAIGDYNGIWGGKTGRERGRKRDEP